MYDVYFIHSLSPSHGVFPMNFADKVAGIKGKGRLLIKSFHKNRSIGVQCPSKASTTLIVQYHNRNIVGNGKNYAFTKVGEALLIIRRRFGYWVSRTPSDVPPTLLTGGSVVDSFRGYRGYY